MLSMDRDILHVVDQEFITERLNRIERNPIVTRIDGDDIVGRVVRELDHLTVSGPERSLVEKPHAEQYTIGRRLLVLVHMEDELSTGLVVPRSILLGLEGENEREDEHSGREKSSYHSSTST